MAKVCSLPEGSCPSPPVTGAFLCIGKGNTHTSESLGIPITHAHTIHLGIPALTHMTTAGTGSPAKDWSFVGRLRPVMQCLAAADFK